MNTSTSQVVPWEEVQKLKPEERAQYIMLERDLTAKEKADGQIRLYAPCACGSGKKFKFCCKSK
jgi:uncharacterized protein YchJ